MSLIAQAIVVATQGVLQGVTWAGAQVLMQPIDPITEVLRGADAIQKPVIAVYAESAKSAVQGRESQGQKTKLALKVYVYICPGMVKLPDGVDFALDGTTAGLALNVVGRQVDAAFHSGNSDWIKIWRKMVLTIEEREVRYILVEVENAVRVPTMEISYSLETIPDPDFGNPMTAAWVLLDTKLRTTGEGTKLADLIKGLIENPAGLPSYVDIQNNHALTDAALAETGLGPFEATAIDVDGEPVVLVDAEPIGEVVPVGTLP